MIKLAEHDVISEQLGGDIQTVEVSAKTGKGTILFLTGSVCYKFMLWYEFMPTLICLENKMFVQTNK